MVNDLPKMMNGKPVTYSWSEPTVSGYSLKKTGDTNGILTTLTNEYKPAETEVSVRKEWADGNGAKRPSSVSVQLYADNKAMGAPVTLDSSNGWSYKWTELPKNVREGELVREIEYTVAETEIPEGYVATISGSASTGFVITNTFETGKLEIEKEFEFDPQEPFEPDDSPLDIPVIKTWNDNGNKDGNRPESVTVRLLADGTEVAKAVLNDANGWKTVFTGLPRLREDKERIEYTITEDPVKWYTAEINGYNIRNNYKPELTSVSVQKVWQDNNNAEKQRPTSIVMTLSNGMSVVLNEQNNWKATINDLPAWVNGKPAVYTWSEQTVIGYELTSKVTEGSLTTFTNALWKRPDHKGGKKPKTPGTPVEYIDEYDTPLGVEIMINHVGDCFD